MKRFNGSSKNFIVPSKYSSKSRFFITWSCGLQTLGVPGQTTDEHAMFQSALKFRINLIRASRLFSLRLLWLKEAMTKLMIFTQITSSDGLSEGYCFTSAWLRTQQRGTFPFQDWKSLISSEIFKAFEINSCTCLSLLFIVIVMEQIPILPGPMAWSSHLNRNVRHVLRSDESLQDEMENISWLYWRCNHGKLNISNGRPLDR